MISFYITMAIIALIFFVCLTICAKTPWIAEDDSASRKFKSGRWVAMGAILIIVALVTGVKGIRILDSTEIGVVKTFGKISHTIDGGLNFVNPVADKVDTYDMKVHVKEAAFDSYTKDAQPITAAIEYQYELLPDKVLDVAKQFGSYEILESKLAVVVEERAKIVFARYSAMPLLEERSTLSSQVYDEVAELETNFPIHFTSVVVKDVDFSDAFEAAVEAKMQAEQNALKAENEKKEAVTRAEQNREVARIEGEAKVAESEAEAEALKVLREAYENMPDNWIAQQYLEKWNGELPQIVTGDSTGIMLTPDLE